MASSTVISGNELCFENFDTAEGKYKKIIALLKTAGLEEALGTSTRIYTKLVREFYKNGTYNEGILTTQVKGVQIRLSASEINLALGFENEGLLSLNVISTEEGLKRMHHKKNPELKGLKKKEFPQKYEFLADIVGKCLLCKDSAHDSVSDQQLRIMTAIVKRVRINYGNLLLQWIGNWTQAAGKTKGSRKMFYGRFISIILQSALGDKIEDNEGEILNANKRMTQKLFENWKRNPVENRRLTQSEDSEQSQSKDQRPSLMENLPINEEVSEEESPLLIRKSKGKKKTEEISQNKETQGMSTEESDDLLTAEPMSSSATSVSMPKKRKSSVEGTDEITPISQEITKGRRSKRARKTSLSTIAEHSLSPIVESRIDEELTQLAMTDAEPEPSEEIALPEKATLPTILELSEEDHSEGESPMIQPTTGAPIEGEIVEHDEVMKPTEEESEDEEVEIIAVGRSEERHISYQSLFKFLPMMPFYQALVDNSWTQLFWTFKVYPNVTILAHGYPRELQFAKKMLTNSSSSVQMQKVCFVPKHFTVVHNPTPFFHIFNSQDPPVVESLNSTTDNLTHSTTNTPIPPIVESLHSTITSSVVECPDTHQPTQPSLLCLTLPHTPSTSHSTPTEEPLGTASTTEDSTILLRQILDRVSQIPTVEGLTDLTVHLEEEIHDDIAKSSSDLHTRINDIVQAANNLPGNLGRELTTRLRNMFKTVSESLQSRDALFLNEIAKHREAVNLLQTSNDKSIALLSNQVFEMKSLLRDHMFSSDSTLARLQAQQDQADARLREHRSDVTASQAQMTELLQSIQLLSDKVEHKDDANKGENSTRGDKGKRGGRGGGERIHTSVRPPRVETSRPPSSSTARPFYRPSSSSIASDDVASDLQRWHQEIAIKEEEAIIREEMELRREEEERRERFRKREEERSDRQRR